MGHANFVNRILGDKMKEHAVTASLKPEEKETPVAIQPSADLPSTESVPDGAAIERLLANNGKIRQGRTFKSS